jgi:hypothetical protein
MPHAALVTKIVSFEVPSSTMSSIANSIVLSASMFGAIYLFSISLIGMNIKWKKQGKAELSAYEILNATIMILSGGVIFSTTIKAFNMLTK